MSQIKIYGINSQLIPIREKFSQVIHSGVMETLGLPADKRAHRFFPLDKDNFLMPGGRTDAYTIIEISMIAGRTVETQKRKLIRLLFDEIQERSASNIGIWKSAFTKARLSIAGSRCGYHARILC